MKRKPAAKWLRSSGGHSEIPICTSAVPRSEACPGGFRLCWEGTSGLWVSQLTEQWSQPSPEIAPKRRPQTSIHTFNIPKSPGHPPPCAVNMALLPILLTFLLLFTNTQAQPNSVPWDYLRKTYFVDLSCPHKDAPFRYSTVEMFRMAQQLVETMGEAARGENQDFVRVFRHVMKIDINDPRIFNPTMSWRAIWRGKQHLIPRVSGPGTALNRIQGM